jgi:hypothetical protein
MFKEVFKKIITKSSKLAQEELSKKRLDTSCPECGGVSMPTSRSYKIEHFECCNRNCKCEWDMKSN